VLENANEHDLTTDDIKFLKRQLWMACGITDHDIDHKLLTQIHDRYERINEVPSGYYYAEIL
jgi:hypothetical protein